MAQWRKVGGSKGQGRTPASVGCQAHRPAAVAQEEKPRPYHTHERVYANNLFSLEETANTAQLTIVQHELVVSRRFDLTETNTSDDTENGYSHTQEFTSIMESGSDPGNSSLGTAGYYTHVQHVFATIAAQEIEVHSHTDTSYVHYDSDEFSSSIDTADDDTSVAGGYHEHSQEYISTITGSSSDTNSKTSGSYIHYDSYEFSQSLTASENPGPGSVTGDFYTHSQSYSQTILPSESTSSSVGDGSTVHERIYTSQVTPSSSDSSSKVVGTSVHVYTDNSHISTSSSDDSTSSSAITTHTKTYTSIITPSSSGSSSRTQVSRIYDSAYSSSLLTSGTNSSAPGQSSTIHSKTYSQSIGSSHASNSNSSDNYVIHTYTTTSGLGGSDDASSSARDRNYVIHTYEVAMTGSGAWQFNDDSAVNSTKTDNS